MPKRRRTDLLVVHVMASSLKSKMTTAKLRAIGKSRGMRDAPYNEWISHPDGKLHSGRRGGVHEQGAHVKGYNSISFGIALEGGQRGFDATPAMMETLERRLRELQEIWPDAGICGHRDLSPDKDGDGLIEPEEHIKSCPWFDAIPWAASKGLLGADIKGVWSEFGKDGPDHRDRELQLMLRALGYSLVADGIVGPITRGQTKQFQRDNGLRVTGKFDAATVAVLERLSAGKVQPKVSRYITRAMALEIISHEAMVLRAYKDSGGTWTWSAGITHWTGYDVKQWIGRDADMQTAVSTYLKILREQYLPVVLDVFQGRALTEQQRAVALSFCWHRGPNGFRKAEWVRLFKRGDMSGARKALEQHGSSAFRSRRKKEAACFFDGVWSNDGTATVIRRLTRNHQPIFSSAERVNIDKEIRQALGAEPVPAPSTPKPTRARIETMSILGAMAMNLLPSLAQMFFAEGNVSGGRGVLRGIFGNMFGTKSRGLLGSLFGLSVTEQTGITNINLAPVLNPVMDLVKRAMSGAQGAVETASKGAAQAATETVIPLFSQMSPTTMAILLLGGLLLNGHKEQTVRKLTEQPGERGLASDPEEGTSAAEPGTVR